MALRTAMWVVRINFQIVHSAEITACVMAHSSAVTLPTRTPHLEPGNVGATRTASRWIRASLDGHAVVDLGPLVRATKDIASRLTTPSIGIEVDMADRVAHSKLKNAVAGVNDVHKVGIVRVQVLTFKISDRWI
uniref:Putative secreted protein n=1 Tax=Ixodes ricinus TaxID=34613 RepID=A0A6B0URS1_IXORI